MKGIRVSRIAIAAGAALCLASSSIQAQPFNPTPPPRPVKLIFIHHSCGENWLSDDNGGLARRLVQNNYFVSDTNYGWGPEGIGDRTDITDWPAWFLGTNSARYLAALYRESQRHCDYLRPIADPGGENQIVMLKSCFPNSNLAGRPNDPPRRGEGLTVSNAKAIYCDLLAYFATRPDKLFVVITAPPVQDATYAANARAFNTWLVRDWLSAYPGRNVAVFDFYNVLTGPQNHHRFRDGRIAHVIGRRQDTLFYGSPGDDHPTPAGNRKATAQFVPLLNAYYHRWIATAPRPRLPRRSLAEIAVRARAVLPPPPPVAVAVGNRPVLPPVVRIETIFPGSSDAAATGSPAGPRPRLRIDDFDHNVAGWQAIFDETSGTRLSIAHCHHPRHNGAGAMQIHYDVAPGAWAMCSLIHPQPHNWSGYEGLSLFVHAEQVGQPFTVVVYGGRSPEDLLHFAIQLWAGEAAVRGWQQFVVRWDQLRLPSWQGTAAERLNTGSVMGVALGFHAGEAAQNAGRIWIDDVELW